jgi:putative transposase
MLRDDAGSGRRLDSPIDHKTMVDVAASINEYLDRTDWRVNANTNQGYSLGGLILNLSGKVTDFASRYLISCEALSSTKQDYAFPVFESTFKEFGLPRAIRTDNGVPFASPNALFNLSKLSVWWLRLGIAIERIKPGNPQQNGRHERMHLTLKLETIKPAAGNILQQQDKFDDFIDCYNNERPHQALGMQCPTERYLASTRPYQGLPELDYPLHDKTVTVTTCGRICFNRRKINLNQVFAGQNLGIKQVSDEIWLVTFMDYDLGYFDDETGRLEPVENPFGPKVLPMSPE